MSLKILSITKVPPAAPYGDATRKRPLNIVVKATGSPPETIRVHESDLDEFARVIMLNAPPGVSASTVLAVLWGLWKHRKRGASLASILNVDIEQ